jgi:hypothetical protein
VKHLCAILLIVVAGCASAPTQTPAVASAVARDLPGPWTVTEGGAAFFKAESVLFSSDGRIRITREGKLRRGTWSMVDGMLEVKGIEQTARFEVSPTTDGMVLTPLVERNGSWRRTDALITMRGARVLPAKAG